MSLLLSLLPWLGQEASIAHHAGLPIGQLECLLTWLLDSPRVSDPRGTETKMEAEGPLVSWTQTWPMITFTEFSSLEASHYILPSLKGRRTRFHHMYLKLTSFPFLSLLHVSVVLPEITSR